MTFSWQGVFPAIITPFRSDDSLDMAMFEQNLRAQLTAGVDGIIIGGSLGEASTLTTDEKRQLTTIARAVGGSHLPLIVNIAESSTREGVAQAELAASWNADGLMLLPPMRYRSDDRETVEYFRAIAASTSLPIMIYNNPVDYKIDITIDMFAELVQCPNITAVKESTRDVTNVTRLRNRFGDRLSILCGVDTLALEELLLGADGWVAGLVNAFPKETVAIYKLARSGRIAEATVIYRWFMPLLELDIHPKLVQYIKLASEITGIGSEHVRAPRLPLEGAERERILHVILEGVRSRPNMPAEGWD
ncbi:MAG: dihydrodipicolinate synthase family protein [Chitinophagaceae bacterium]|jgi:dihydrodipicolinate synthase/N-acetylneuraminate lyase|nr:dihydrodipicolinate synthase family protein [Chitinophagaceae bacterium]